MDNLSKSFDLATTEVRLELVTYVRTYLESVSVLPCYH
jgi:hypothetical protein